MLNELRRRMVNGYIMLILWTIDLELKNKHLDGKSKANLIEHRANLEKVLSAQRLRRNN